MMPAYDAVAFDLLTALIDSWTLWNSAAGSPESGLRWRKRYLEITYGCGAYRPYLTLVRNAAAEVGLPASCAATLEARWGELRPWPEVVAVLGRLAARVPLAVATNCSQRLGRMAASRVGNLFKVVITAERAGYYKPRPEPYLAMLAALGTTPQRTLFVAGSASDVPGAHAVGMPAFWHNRIGLAPRGEAKPEFCEPSLARLPEIVLAGD
jgi:2-haloalkanoic acid dehalogenase type II